MADSRQPLGRVFEYVVPHKWCNASNLEPDGLEELDVPFRRARGIPTLGAIGEIASDELAHPLVVVLP